ncbi:4-hydroxy-tetrahydrodipicolinate synthase [Geothrix sp. PMB-07]|uniref:4-hydroxy-tetrahydrodipicolinate synthase n=1 Tax=Geothrix sp. PMB-07 TaxID=3068640 RepID=UPI0027423D73|nr:4-hydroxy-tetrahydrodipicolinate synthase [Geothrix sp. PMB-07]WLT33488.1 4-hydroxy-tetrahydrodipicolinate synthase [Geothrix sp. PMB-07]
MTPLRRIVLDLQGLLVALPTPFTADQAIDLPAFRLLARRVVAAGVSGLVPLGSTGEASALEETERDAILQVAVEEAQGRPVVAGTGSHSTRQTIAWTRRARQLGARAALVVTPYYTRPTQCGLVAHYKAIAEAVPGFPLIAYNVPSRTGVNLEPPTLRSLWRIPEVVGVKESSGNLVQIGQIAQFLPKGKVLLAGDDGLAAPSIARGARGLVSVLGNAYPEAALELVHTALEGKQAEAHRLQEQLRPLVEALFHETNPVPLKALLHRLGLCSDQVRLPLLPASPGTQAVLSAAVHRAQVA